MDEYGCPNCNNNTFKLTKIDECEKQYGYELWKLECMNCGEQLENDNYTYLLNTFTKTRREIGNIVNEFTNDANILKNSMEKLLGFKQNTGELENIIKKLNFIYYEENTELINNTNTIAILIKYNLPNEVDGEIAIDKTKDKEQKDIKLTNKLSSIGTIRINRDTNNVIEVRLKIGNKKVEILKIDKPFRIIQVILRLNEMLNFTN